VPKHNPAPNTAFPIGLILCRVFILSLPETW
jgi:hypothetical protein